MNKIKLIDNFKLNTLKYLNLIKYYFFFLSILNLKIFEKYKEKLLKISINYKYGSLPNSFFK